MKPVFTLLIVSLALAASAEQPADCFSAIYALQEQRLEQAVELYSRCIETGNLSKRNLIVAYNDRGNARARMDELAGALEDFNRVLELAPEDADAWYNRGLTHKHLGRLEAAVDDYTHALALRPTYAKAYNNRGTVYGARGLFQTAIADFNQAIELKPGDASAWFNRGLARLSQGDYAGAARDLRAAIEIEPDYLKAYKRLAWLLATSPDPDVRDGSAALLLAKRARLLLGESNADINQVMAAAYAADGQYSEAAEYQALAIELLQDTTATTVFEEQLNLYHRGLRFEESASNQFRSDDH